MPVFEQGVASSPTGGPEDSIPRQAELLEDGGLLAHAFWYGDKIEEHGGLHFQFYEESDIAEIFGGHFDIVLMERYEEMEPGDSIFAILKKIKHVSDVIPTDCTK